MQTMNSVSQLRINEHRFKHDFDILSKIGETLNGGVCRPAFSQAHFETREWFRKKAEKAGLKFSIDGAANHIACHPSKTPDARTLIIGSHLDSVPTGGKFDGALGVAAGLEVLQTIQEKEIELPFNLDVIDFTDEEGWLVSFLGSYAFTGKLLAENLSHPRGGLNIFLEGTQKAGISPASILEAKRKTDELAGYLELHVEQAPRLVLEQKDIGIVTSIAGIKFGKVLFFGKSDHAGTTPMQNRYDAGLGASLFIQKLHQLVSSYEECYANVGEISFLPGGFNIVPQEAHLSLEFRAPNIELMEILETEIEAIIREIEEKLKIKSSMNWLGSRAPAPLSEKMQKIIAGSVQTLQLSNMQLASGAGHDAQSMASICPTGMIFVPSQGGRSHTPEEHTLWQDCVNGANVLLQSVLKFATYNPNG
jgi:N-carbamoyl-L-amino-acid hydrolase